jgi:tetratricopeptide (TPR) repeat protein
VAKKKHPSAKKRPKTAPKRLLHKPPESDLSAMLPDRRALEGTMKSLFDSLSGSGSDTPLDRAQEVMYKAFDERNPARRVALAMRALEICPDCADGYVLLAEHAETYKEELELYRQAVAAGERALGPDTFHENAGHFWGLLETRPYMRARKGLAHALWAGGRRQEAADHLQEMLELNPNDNQGVRYVLANWLLNLGHDEELESLLSEYDEGSATWAYTAALLAFRREGDSPDARRLLEDATQANAHVPAFLLGDQELPEEHPPHYSFGGESEATMYVQMALSAWRSTPGAIAWLKATEPERELSRSALPAAKTAAPASKKRRKTLTDRGETFGQAFRRGRKTRAEPNRWNSVRSGAPCP